MAHATTRGRARPIARGLHTRPDRDRSSARHRRPRRARQSQLAVRSTLVRACQLASRSRRSAAGGEAPASPLNAPARAAAHAAQALHSTWPLPRGDTRRRCSARSAPPLDSRAARREHRRSATGGAWARHRAPAHRGLTVVGRPPPPLAVDRCSAGTADPVDPQPNLSRERRTPAARQVRTGPCFQGLEKRSSSSTASPSPESRRPELVASGRRVAPLTLEFGWGSTGSAVPA